MFVYVFLIIILFLFLIIYIPALLISFVMKVLTFFGIGRGKDASEQRTSWRTTQDADARWGQSGAQWKEENAQRSKKKNKIVFEKDEGEYVDFEEIKD